MPAPFDLDSIQIDASLPFHDLVESIEIQISNASIEFGFAFNNKGEVVVQKVGESDRICFSHDEIEAMKDCVLTHNHPRRKFFSVEDVRYACLTDLQEIRAVAGNVVHVLRRPADGWDINKFDTTFADELEKIRHDFRMKYVSKAEAQKRANNLVRYVVNKLSLSVSKIRL